MATFIDLDDESDHSDFTLPDESVPIEEFSIQPVVLRNPEQVEDLRDLSSCHYRGLTLRINQAVELRDGDFLLIKEIKQHRITGQNSLEGHLFRRSYHLKGLLEKKKNEVVWIQQYNANKRGDIYRQSLHQVQLREVSMERELILTNCSFPVGSYRDQISNLRLTTTAILETCRLACRWKYLANGDKEGSLLALNQTEVDHWHHSSNSNLQETWRGRTIKGGSCRNWLPGEKEFEKTEQTQSENSDLFGLRFRDDGPEQRYTFGDGFCGAGGVSRGAKAAGLRVHWSFDNDRIAMDTYRLNFFGTTCWNCSANDFITIIPDESKVDVVHLSFPCQPFSPAHSRPGQNDDRNEASFFSLEGILRKTKPRVVMIEETFGLLRTADRMLWFRAMIQVFTMLGFSVRWKIFNLLEYGLPGRRQRLFVYASCPGEPLPDFPRPIHGSLEERQRKTYLAPYRTINDALSQVPANDALKDSTPCNEPPYDGNIPLPNAMCCGQSSSRHPSSRIIHPSGTRKFGSRELASLSTFPLEHKFRNSNKTQMRKQIGNAVPPAVAKIFLEQIVKSLRRTDGIQLEVL